MMGVGESHQTIELSRPLSEMIYIKMLLDGKRAVQIYVL